MSKISEVYEEIELMRKHFGWDQSDTPEFLINCILDEAQELKEAYRQQEEVEVAKELADVLMYALTLANDLGLDVLTIIKEKRLEVMERNYD